MPPKATHDTPLLGTDTRQEHWTHYNRWMGGSGLWWGRAQETPRSARSSGGKTPRLKPKDRKDTRPSAKIITYDPSILPSWRSVTFLTGTVFSQKSLWGGVLNLLVLAATTGIIIGYVLPGLQFLNSEHFFKLCVLIKVLLAFILGLYLSVCLGRWWQTMTFLKHFLNSIKTLSLILNSIRASPERRAAIRRYGLLSAYILRDEVRTLWTVEEEAVDKMWTETLAHCRHRRWIHHQPPPHPVQQKHHDIPVVIWVEITGPNSDGYRGRIGQIRQAGTTPSRNAAGEIRRDQNLPYTLVNLYDKEGWRMWNEKGYPKSSIREIQVSYVMVTGNAKDRSSNRVGDMEVYPATKDGGVYTLIIDGQAEKKYASASVMEVVHVRTIRESDIKVYPATKNGTEYTLIIDGKPDRKYDAAFITEVTAPQKSRRSEEEALSLIAHGGRSEMVWTWIGGVIATLETKSNTPPMSARLNAECTKAMGHLHHCKTCVTYQFPLMYVHTVAVLVHMNNILLAMASGCFIAAEITALLIHWRALRNGKPQMYGIDQKEALYESIQAIAMKLFILIFEPLLYMAFLRIGAAMNDPFGDAGHGVPLGQYIDELSEELDEMTLLVDGNLAARGSIHPASAATLAATLAGGRDDGVVGGGGKKNAEGDEDDDE